MAVGGELGAVTSRREIRRELQRLGWEVSENTHPDVSDKEGLMAGYGPYRLMVAFDPVSEEPTGMVSERSGSETVYTRRWEGLGSLPEPDSVVRRLSRRDDPGQ